MWFLWIGLGLLALLGTAVLIAAYVCYRRIFYSPPRRILGPGEYDFPKGEIYDVFREDMIAWTDMIRTYPYKEYSITSFDGLTLRGKFYECRPNAPVELMFHGYKGNAERDLSGGVERCFQLGHSALLIDHRASGHSDGHTITFGILEMRDCRAWIDFAIREFGEDTRLILTGISMGAATVMNTAGEPLPPQVKYVLADCGYTSAREIISKVMREMGLPPALLYPCVRLGGRLFGGFDPDKTSPLRAVTRAQVPIVFAHGDIDDFVPHEMSARLCDLCTAPHKKLITIHGAGHGLAFPVGRDEYVAELKQFKQECGFDF